MALMSCLWIFETCHVTHVSQGLLTVYCYALLQGDLVPKHFVVFPINHQTKEQGNCESGHEAANACLQSAVLLSFRRH